MLPIEVEWSSEVVALYWTGWTPEIINSGRVGQGSASV
jgi:hypothetical protein